MDDGGHGTSYSYNGSKAIDGWSIIIIINLISIAAVLFNTPSRRFSSCTGTIDLDDVFGNVDELIHQPLAVNFGQDSSLIVVPVIRDGAEKQKQKS